MVIGGIIHLHSSKIVFLILLIPQPQKMIFDPLGGRLQTPGWGPLIYGMVINYTYLPDGHHVGIISSQSWGILPWKCQPGSRVCQCCSLTSYLMSFERSTSLATGVLASPVWRLRCPSPFCHGNYADDSVFLGWVWYVVFTHTQPLKEMSAGLYRRWWQTPWRVPPNRGRAINEFLKDALSTAFSPTVSPSSPNILWTCFSSYHLPPSLFFCSVPSPCTWPFALSPYLLICFSFLSHHLPRSLPPFFLSL